jgi:hypothetical protein
MITVSALPEFMQATANLNAFTIRSCLPRPDVLASSCLSYPSMYQRLIWQEFFANLAIVTLDFEFAQPGCGGTSSAFMCSRTSSAVESSSPTY